MNDTEYIEGALRTECPYGPVLERIVQNPGWVSVIRGVLQLAINEGVHQDQVKKALFYGKEGVLFIPATRFEQLDNRDRAAATKLVEDTRLIRLLHGFLGKLTEAAELQQHLFDVLFKGQPLDPVNIVEEQGDSCWYDGPICAVTGVGLGEVKRINNAKLRARYPEKFTEADAVNRDLDTEREVLEGKAPEIVTDPTGPHLAPGQSVADFCDAYQKNNP
jgi:hypothetical protein